MFVGPRQSVERKTFHRSRFNLHESDLCCGVETLDVNRKPIAVG
jgi:hypothetical protein